MRRIVWRFLAHGSVLIERSVFEEMCNRFLGEIAATRASRFRGGWRQRQSIFIRCTISWLEKDAAVLRPTPRRGVMTGHAP
ncbi:MAG: stealth conserved region 3 domain-containing protein [Alphaproteobacteria bacterium]|nr:stealth conserved region 3 domain-containing protein [Alphaproteobacteria bacterium]